MPTAEFCDQHSLIESNIKDLRCLQKKNVEEERRLHKKIDTAAEKVGEKAEKKIRDLTDKVDFVAEKITEKTDEKIQIIDGKVEKKVSFKLFGLLVTVLLAVLIIMGGISISTNSKVTRLTVQMEAVQAAIAEHNAKSQNTN